MLFRRSSQRLASLIRLSICCLSLCGWAYGAIAAAKPNVLLIAVDDLAPLLGCYGDTVAVTPNIDRLADRGVRFVSAYAQQAVCSASRSSMLTGLRPDSTGVTQGDVHFRQRVPESVTLPQWFKQHGYHTQAFGKIFHGGLDDAPSWSAPTFNPADLPGYGPVGKQVFRERQASSEALQTPPQKRADLFKGPAWEAAAVDDGELPDGEIAAKAIEFLHESRQRPFFLAVGFYKPHLPFVAPRPYWDRIASDKLLIPNATKLPTGAPDCAGHDSFELRKYFEIPATGPVDDEQARNLVHGYYACVSYMDAQIGRLLDELERQKLTDDTVIVFWSDHGWHLGDHGLWCKHTNYESSVRIPLVVSIPKCSRGVAAGIVESVDLYPTLCELAGLSIPGGLEGSSFAPLVRNPQAAGKPAAFSQYPRAVPGYAEKAVGRAIRTPGFRYVEWTITGTDFLERELYDLRSDPAENVNVAGCPEYATCEQELQAQLAVGWRGTASSQK